MQSAMKGLVMLTAVTTALQWKHSHLCHKVCGCVAECFQHGCGFCVEQRHPVGHLVVDFILNVQLKRCRNKQHR